MSLDTFEHEATTMFHDVVACQLCPGVATIRVTGRCCKWMQTVCADCWGSHVRRYTRGCSCRDCGEWYESLPAAVHTRQL